MDMYLKQFLNFFKKVLLNGGIFVLIVICTYRIVFSHLQLSTIVDLLLKAKKEYLLYGFILLLMMLCAEAYNIKRNLHLLHERVRYTSCLVYALVGNFFSGITPAASGGQPMQLYFMYKDKISASKGTLALFMDLGAYQAVITGLGIAGYVGYTDAIHRALGKFIPVLWLGLTLNICLLILLFCAMFSDRFIYRLVSIGVKIIGFFSKTKADSFGKRTAAAIQKYREGAAILKKNKSQYMLNSAIMFFRIIAMHSAPFWVYRALGFSQASFIELLALQSVLYISCAALPFPGGVGIGERIFLLFFKEIFPAGLLGSAMALSRGLGVYTVIGFCGISLMMVWIITTINRLYRRKEGASN